MTDVGVVFGGPSPEHDISILTGLQAARALAEAGVGVTCLYWTKRGDWVMVPSTAEGREFLDPEIAGSRPVSLSVPGGFVEQRRLRPSPIGVTTVLNCCHGGPGEDGSLSALLMLAGIKVTGPTPEAAAAAMDKFATAALAHAVGIPTIQTSLVTATVDPHNAAVKPWVVKPRFGGSSIGVEAGVEDLETVRDLASQGAGRSGMVLQPFLEGWIDLNVAVRTHPERQVSVIERPLREGSAVYNYGEKYLRGEGTMDTAPTEVPAQVPSSVASQVEEFANRIVDALGLTGAPRIDFLWDGEDSVVLCEANAIPGAWANHLWGAAGVDRVALYVTLLEEARKSTLARPQWVASSDGSALRASGSISAKLR